MQSLIRLKITLSQIQRSIIAYPPAVQKQLDLPKDSAGYKTGMENVEIIVRNQKNTFIQRAHREGARYKTSQSSSDSDE